MSLKPAVHKVTFLDFRQEQSGEKHHKRRSFNHVVSFEQRSFRGRCKKEIIDRCKVQMGEYGASMVKACIDQDLDELRALDKYSPEYSPIVDRSMAQMREYGYSMVKACADQDIVAEKALSNYGRPNNPRLSKPLRGNQWESVYV